LEGATDRAGSSDMTQSKILTAYIL
jgi:hypothetical protein